MKSFAVTLLFSIWFGAGVPAGDRLQKLIVVAENGWRLYSPPDKSFTVQVPVTPLTDADTYDAFDKSTTSGWKPIHSYVAIASLDEPRVYFVSVFEAQSATRENQIDEFIQELFKSKHLTSSKQINMNRRRVREFTLASKDTDENQFMRVRLIEVGQRIYMLTYVTNTADDVYSRSAEKFFTSFQIKR